MGGGAHATAWASTSDATQHKARAKKKSRGARAHTARAMSGSPVGHRSKSGPHAEGVTVSQRYFNSDRSNRKVFRRMAFPAKFPTRATKSAWQPNAIFRDPSGSVVAAGSALAGVRLSKSQSNPWTRTNRAYHGHKVPQRPPVLVSRSSSRQSTHSTASLRPTTSRSSAKEETRRSAETRLTPRELGQRLQLVSVDASKARESHLQ